MSFRVILIILTVCIYGFVLKPWWGEYSEKKELLQTTQEQSEAAKAKLEELQQIEVESAEAGDENALEKIPVSKEQAQVIKDLEQISTSSGFTFRSLGFGKATDPKAKAERLTVSLSVRGSYDRLFYFLSLIQQNPRYIGIKDLKLASQSSTDGERTANLSLSLFVLHQQ